MIYETERADHAPWDALARHTVVWIGLLALQLIDSPYLKARLLTVLTYAEV